MATKRQRRKKRRRRSPTAEEAPGAERASTGPPARDINSLSGQATEGRDSRSGRIASDIRAADPADARPTRGTGPPPPWGSFPLSEIVIAIALVLLIGGFVIPPPRGAVMLGAGLVLGSLAGLELSIREHFAGYKSHTTLLAGAAGIAVLGALFVVGPRDLAPAAKVAAAIVVFALAFLGLTRTFRRRSGGALFKTRA